jgi:hypothetical protein
MAEKCELSCLFHTGGQQYKAEGDKSSINNASFLLSDSNCFINSAENAEIYQRIQEIAQYKLAIKNEASMLISKIEKLSKTTIQRLNNKLHDFRACIHQGVKLNFPRPKENIKTSEQRMKKIILQLEKLFSYQDTLLQTKHHKSGKNEKIKLKAGSSDKSKGLSEVNDLKTNKAEKRIIKNMKKRLGKESTEERTLKKQKVERIKGIKSGIGEGKFDEKKNINKLPVNQEFEVISIYSNVKDQDLKLVDATLDSSLCENYAVNIKSLDEKIEYCKRLGLQDFKTKFYQRWTREIKELFFTNDKKYLFACIYQSRLYIQARYHQISDSINKSR